MVDAQSGKWRPTLAEIIFAVLLAIVPWSIPAMGVGLRSSLWFVAAVLILHLIVSYVPVLAALPIFVRIVFMLAAIAVGSGFAYHPIMQTWREEKSNALTGTLDPEAGNPLTPVQFKIGPNAKATIIWTGPSSVMPLAQFGNYIGFTKNHKGQIVANAVVRDREGHMLVEIVANEWRVSSASWEKNYTRSVLEVKDGDGKIVFQLRLFPDRAEIQAEFWDRDGNGLRLVQIPDPRGSDKMAADLYKMTPTNHLDDPAIQPIFRYPSKRYFGQLKGE